jgi:hypothetical protein
MGTVLRAVRLGGKTVTMDVQFDNWAEAEIARLSAAIAKLGAEAVPDIDLIAGHKRVMAAVQVLQQSLARKLAAPLRSRRA